MPTLSSSRWPAPDGPWLLQQHRRLTTRHAARLGRSIAEDLASEAVARCLRQPAPDGQHDRWLERIFANLVVDHHRRRGRSARHARWLPAPLPPPSPEDLVLQDERIVGLAGAWPQLPPEQRQALLARFSDEATHLARQSGLPLPTIRTRVHRGLALLRRALARLGAVFPLPLPLSLSPLSSLHPLAATLAPLAAAALLLTPILPRPARPDARPARVVAQAVPSARPAAARPTTAAPAPAIDTPGSGNPPGRAPVEKANPADPRRGAAAGGVRRFDFEDDQLTGDLQRPDGDQVPGAAPRARQPSLIEIPASFLGAIAQSLQDI